MKGSTLVVVGSSAGGMAALTKLVAQLPVDFPAPVFIVNHMAADATGAALLQALNSSGSLECSHPVDGQAFEGGRVYLAPPDHHMLIAKNVIRVTKGARENRSRPAIDPLFRSAAVAYGSKVVAIVLTGNLDDGTAGLSAVKRCGGVTVVQDPDDADYPGMPRSALNSGVEIDHRVRVAEMGALLTDLVHRKPSKDRPVPRDVAIEARIAEHVLSDVASVEALGHQVPFNCPGCGGVLWQVDGDDHLRYRCHTGHSFTSTVLLAEQTVKIEETLWVALRMFEERKNLLTNMAASGARGASKSLAERASESQVHIDRIRAILLSSDTVTEGAGDGPASANG
jgi:two-component system, chemotaxis family, protein-glutamate methylesterase/glutaminase